MTLRFDLDGAPVEVPDDGSSLLVALREHLGVRSPKDGCSPQGQCGCCTVLVDGQPRVSCVTPTRRVEGREVTTLAGLPDADRRRWAGSFLATGASQCGFCTPGIVMRFAGMQAKGVDPDDEAAVCQGLAAHLCRCTGWRSVVDAYREGCSADPEIGPPSGRDLDAAARRATIEGGVPQVVGLDVAMGEGGFADDLAPPGCLVAVPDGEGGWALGETLAEARAASGKVQGRRSTAELRHPVEVPPGDWAVTLQTTWVEPAYLETDASWCAPGGEPASPLGNGGAFGGKTASIAPAAARELADRHGRPVRVLLPREHTVANGPKRPPLAAGVRADGVGVVRVVATPGIAERIQAAAPGLEVEEVHVIGPPTSAALRAAGWAEATVLMAAAAGSVGRVVGPSGGWAEAAIGPDGAISVKVGCGAVLDEVVLRSYCTGAAHMALSWVTSEGIAVDDDGSVVDLTVRSFGVVPARSTPPIHVEVQPSDSEPVNGSDAVFAAVAAAVWLAKGCPPTWPTGIM